MSVVLVLHLPIVVGVVRRMPPHVSVEPVFCNVLQVFVILVVFIHMYIRPMIVLEPCVIIGLWVA